MNLTKINSERIKELLHNSLSYDVRGPSEDDREIDTTDDVDLLLNELLALRKLAEDMAHVIEGLQEELRLIRMKDTNVVYDPTIRVRTDLALEAYHSEYPKEER